MTVGDPMHLLFVCGRNRLRSPTAEEIFSGRDGIAVASAGLNPEAVEPITPDLLQWADVVFVMEKGHLSRLRQGFGEYLDRQRVVCLDIADRYEFMDAELVELLTARVSRYLGWPR